MANRISPLDEAASLASASLRIYSNSVNAISNVKKVLESEGPRNGTVSIVSAVDMQQITLELAGKFPVSPAIAQALKAISGVDDVQEI